MYSSIKPLISLILCIYLSRFCIADNRIIHIAADPWCPYNCDPTSKHQGLMVDIAREALALSGYTLKYQTMNWARAKVEVKAGKLDGIVGMALTANSEALYHFPKIPLGQSQICVFKRATDDWTYTSVDSLNGKIFGWINEYGFSTDPLNDWVNNNKNTKNIITIAGKNTHTRLFQLLTLNRIDAFAEDKNVIAFELKNARLNHKIVMAGCLKSIEHVYVAFSLNAASKDKWTNALDEGIKTLSSNGRLEKILSDYGQTRQNWLSEKHLNYLQ